MNCVRLRLQVRPVERLPAGAYSPGAGTPAGPGSGSFGRSQAGGPLYRPTGTVICVLALLPTGPLLRFTDLLER